MTIRNLVIDTAHGESGILRRLLELWYKEDEIDKLDKVIVPNHYDNDDPFTENMVADVIEAFKHIKSKGIVWNELNINQRNPEDIHFQSLLEQICELDMFRCIVIHGYVHDNNFLSEATGLTLCNAMKNNQNLYSLEIICTRMQQNISSVLLDGLGMANPNLKDFALFRVQFDDVESESCLGTAMRNNRNLKNLSIQRCNASDAGFTRIVRALDSHPTLENVTLSLCSLPSTPPRRDGGLIQVLPTFKESLEELVQNVYKLPNLIYLNISFNELSKFPTIDEPSAKFQLRQSKLKYLNIYDSILDDRKHDDAEENKANLLRLVRSASQLGYVNIHPSMITNLIQHYLDWNRCGKVLTTTKDNSNERTVTKRPLPLSVWPIVFARANKIIKKDMTADIDDDDDDNNNNNNISDDNSRSALDRLPSVIYRLFHGYMSSLQSGNLPPPPPNSSSVDNNKGDSSRKPPEKRQKNS